MGANGGDQEPGRRHPGADRRNAREDAGGRRHQPRLSGKLRAAADRIIRKAAGKRAY